MLCLWVHPEDPTLVADFGDLVPASLILSIGMLDY